MSRLVIEFESNNKSSRKKTLKTNRHKLKICFVSHPARSRFSLSTVSMSKTIPFQTNQFRIQKQFYFKQFS